MDTQKKRHTDWKSGASWHWAESRGSHKWACAYSHQQLQGPSKGSPLGPLERVWACQHWHFRLLALELWYSTFFCFVFSPGKWIECLISPTMPENTWCALTSFWSYAPGRQSPGLTLLSIQKNDCTLWLSCEFTQTGRVTTEVHAPGCK